MPGIVTAWLVGEGIIFWRSWRQDHRFPVPGQLLAASFIFAMLAIVAESERARSLATTMAWGFDIAALLNVLPQITTGGTNTGPSPIATTSGQAPSFPGFGGPQNVPTSSAALPEGTVAGQHGR